MSSMIEKKRKTCTVIDRVFFFLNLLVCGGFYFHTVVFFLFNILLFISFDFQGLRSIVRLIHRR